MPKLNTVGQEWCVRETIRENNVRLLYIMLSKGYAIPRGWLTEIFMQISEVKLGSWASHM